MKYLVASFNIETAPDLMEAARDLLADGAAEAGFESFEETETGMEAYVQKDLFDKEALDAYISDFLSWMPKSPMTSRMPKTKTGIRNGKNKDSLLYMWAIKLSSTMPSILNFIQIQVTVQTSSR